MLGVGVSSGWVWQWGRVSVCTVCCTYIRTYVDLSGWGCLSITVCFVVDEGVVLGTSLGIVVGGDVGVSVGVRVGDLMREVGHYPRTLLVFTQRGRGGQWDRCPWYGSVGAFLSDKKSHSYHIWLTTTAFLTHLSFQVRILSLVSVD